jgi:hypothetical protein
MVDKMNKIVSYYEIITDRAKKFQIVVLNLEKCDFEKVK